MTVTETQPEATDADEVAEAAAVDSPADAVVDEVLVEEISIDGMCGVY